MRRIHLLPLLALFLFSCVKDFQEISISTIDNFQVKQLTQEGIEAEVKVKIKNPNSVGFNVYRSSCDVYYGETYLGKAKLNKKVRIAPNSDVEHTFKLSGKFKDISFASLTGLLAGKSQNLELKGYIKAGKFFYKKKFPVDRKQKIGLSR